MTTSSTPSDKSTMISGNAAISGSSAPATVAGCLRCHQADAVVSVPAVVRSERSVTRVAGSVVSSYGYEMPLRASAQHVSALAMTLAAPRRAPSVVGPAVALGVTALMALVSLQVAVTPPGSGDAAVLALILMIVAAGCGTLLWLRHRQAAARGPLVRRALMLWHWCWYCRRCGVVSVLTPAGGAVLPSDHLAAHLLDLAGRLRWQDPSASGHVE